MLFVIALLSMLAATRAEVVTGVEYTDGVLSWNPVSTAGACYTVRYGFCNSGGPFKSDFSCTEEVSVNFTSVVISGAVPGTNYIVRVETGLEEELETPYEVTFTTPDAVCEPACVNGECGKIDGTCVCSEGFSGATCEDAVPPSGCECTVSSYCYGMSLGGSPIECGGQYLCGSASCQIYGCVSGEPSLNPKSCSYSRHSVLPESRPDCCGSSGCAACNECAAYECWNDEAGLHTCPEPVDCSALECGACQGETQCEWCSSGSCITKDSFCSGTVGECPAPCSTYTTCESCSEAASDCGWCDGERVCQARASSCIDEGETASSFCPSCDAHTCTMCEGMTFGSAGETCSYCVSPSADRYECMSDCSNIATINDDGSETPWTQASSCAGTAVSCPFGVNCYGCGRLEGCSWTFVSYGGESQSFCHDANAPAIPGATFRPQPCDPLPCPDAPVVTGFVFLGCTSGPIAASRQCAGVAAVGYTCTGGPAVCSGGSYTNMPVCEAEAVCTAPTPPAGASTTCGAATPSGSTCSLVCPSGFTKTADYLCSQGTWNSVDCTAEAATDCVAEPAAVENAVSTGTCGRVATGGTCLLRCAPGFAASASEYVCTDAVWSAPTCSAPPPPPEVINANSAARSAMSVVLVVLCFVFLY